LLLVVAYQTRAALALNLALVNLNRLAVVNPLYASELWGIGLRVGTGKVDERIRQRFEKTGPEREEIALPPAKPVLQVVELLERAVDWDPGLLQARRVMARLYLAQDQPDMAMNVLLMGVSLPARSLLWNEIGDAYYAMGLHDEAVTAYEQSGGLGRERLMLRHYLGRVESLLNAGNSELAKPLLERVLVIWPHSLYALQQLVELGDGNKAQTIATQDKLRYFDLVSLELRGDPLLDRYDAMAMSSLVREGIWERDAILNIASFLVWQDQSTRTQGLLQALLEEWPEDADLWFYLGDLYYRRGDLNKAQGIYQHVIELNSMYARAYLRLGMVAETNYQSYRVKTFLREAVHWFETYRQMRPNDLLVLKRLGEAYQALGEVRKAQEIKEKLRLRTDDQAIVAELLGIPVNGVNVGENLLQNQGFEIRQDLEEQKPEDGKPAPDSWEWRYMANWGPYDSALLTGGVDDLEHYDGQRALRLNGFWVKGKPGLHKARAGYRYVGGVLELKSDTPYVLSLYYRTKYIGGETPTVWASNSREIGFVRDQRLPNTDGDWRKVAVVGWTGNIDNAREEIALLLRIWGMGEIEFDEVSLREISLEADVHMDGHSTIVGLR